METNATRALGRQLYDFYARKDADAIQSLIHDDIDWTMYGPEKIFPFQGHRSGKTAVLQVLQMIGEEYELQRYEPEFVIADGDRVAAISNVAFRRKSSGRVLSFKVANFMRVQDGRIIEFREFSDTFNVAEQALGHFIEV
jgi:ketosteroid isomerase-like protein